MTKGHIGHPWRLTLAVVALYNHYIIHILVVYVGIHVGYSPKGTQLFHLNKCKYVISNLFMFLLFTRLLEDIHILKELWQRKGRENNAWTVSKDTRRYVPGSKLLWFPYKRGWSQVPLQSTTLPAFQKFLPSKGEALIMGCKKRIANKASEVKHNPVGRRLSFFWKVTF